MLILLLLWWILFVYSKKLFIFFFLGRGEHYHNLSVNNIDHVTYMTDADTNSLDMVDSDENIHYEEVIQQDIPSAGGFYKVFIYSEMYTPFY